MKSKFIVLYVLILALAAFTNFYTTMDVPVSKPLSEFPPALGEWALVKNNIFSEDILEVLKPSDYLDRQYVNREGLGVSAYVGYHSGGPGVGAIHSPRNCLPGSGWFEISSEPIVLNLPGRTIHAVSSIYSKAEVDVMFVYWFELDGFVADNEYKLKLAEVANSITKRRKDSAFLRFTMPVTGSREKTLALIESFITEFDPVIHEYLPFGEYK